VLSNNICECPLDQCEHICGNSLLESPEECDDKNQESNDGCSETCEIEEGWDC